MSKESSPENAVRPPFFTRGFIRGSIVAALLGVVALSVLVLVDYRKESARISEFRQLTTREEQRDYLLRLHEGLSYVAYQDSLGKWTGGVGHLLEGRYSRDQIDQWRRGIPERQVWQWLEEDTTSAQQQLENVFGREQWFRQAPDHVWVVLNDMTFNMGIGQTGGSKGLLGFNAMVRNLRDSRWDGASEEMLDSLWRYQTGKRSHRLAYLMRHGELGTSWIPQFYRDFVMLRKWKLGFAAVVLLASIIALRLWWCGRVEVQSFNELSLKKRVLYLLQTDGRSSNCGAISNALDRMAEVCGHQPWFRSIFESESNRLAVFVAASIAMGGWESFQGPDNVEIFECAEEGCWQSMPYTLAACGVFNAPQIHSLVRRVLA
ncbi:MAG: hypothetical protein KDD66_01690 [Bdellovibrionales bacterium]|nr:hypothetical protein [Bdellovibrionales bacterium]